MTPKKLETPVEIPHSIVRPKEEPKSEITLPVPPPEPTLQEKINSNFYKCDTNLQWIRADTAECKDKSTNITQTSQTSATGSPVASGGNLYVPGNCTWYVKSRRPDIPNRMGNANRWIASAIAHGLSTGSIPRPGAVGVTLAGSMGHVVLVETVNGDGTVTISEMNYKGLGVVSSRTVSASAFTYIY